MTETTPTRLSPARLLAAAVVIGAGVFVADLTLPLGASVPSLYVLVVLLGLWSPGSRFTTAAAVATSMLTLLGTALSPTGPTPWTATVNRPVALLLIWMTALGVLYHRRAEARRHRAEAALGRQQALAQLGSLAAMVAHEVRNPLAGIRATVQMLAKRLEPGDQATVKALFGRIDALNDMTENLLLFARPRPLQRSALPLKPLLHEAAELLTRDQRWSGMSVEVSGDDAAASADGLALRGVFFNLMLNAAQAMDGGGTIRVALETSGRNCRVSVADSGPGIPAELRERVFEPFFTTKHRGTGLGLALVRRQVELHDGDVSLSCPPEGGTLVTVRLPLAAA